MAQKPESNFRKRVRKFLRTLQMTEAFPVQQLGINGTPDYLLSSSGYFVGLELKDDNGSLTKLQRFTLTKLNLKKSIGLVATPANWDKIKSLLITLDQGESIECLKRNRTLSYSLIEP